MASARPAANVGLVQNTSRSPPSGKRVTHTASPLAVAGATGFLGRKMSAANPVNTSAPPAPAAASRVGESETSSTMGRSAGRPAAAMVTRANSPIMRRPALATRAAQV